MTRNETAMPNCLNCGAFVTERYARLFAPVDFDTVRVCPRCDDEARDGATVREARSNRR